MVVCGLGVALVLLPTEASALHQHGDALAY